MPVRTLDDSEQAADILNQNLDRVKNWAQQWIVDFNAEKTKCMNISNHNRQQLPVYFNGVELEDVDSHKHLGVTLSNTLSWSKHIDSIASNVTKMIDVIRMLKYDVDRESLETIYFTYMRPKLEYASQIWDDCSKRDKDKLENIQLYAARIVTGAKKGTSHQLLYNETCWPTLADRRKNVKLAHMHKIINKNVPSYLSDILPPKVGDAVEYGLRNRCNFIPIACRTEKLRKSFIPDGLRLWNDLEAEVRSIEDIPEFKNRLKDVSTKSFKLFNFGERHLNIIHSQLRLQCSNLKAHLYSLHVVDDPHCHCNAEVEDSSHFFMQCPLYHVQRLELINSVQQLCNFNVNILLYGDDTLDLVTWNKTKQFSVLYIGSKRNLVVLMCRSCVYRSYV